MRGRRRFAEIPRVPDLVATVPGARRRQPGERDGGADSDDVTASYEHLVVTLQGYRASVTARHLSDERLSDLLGDAGITPTTSKGSVSFPARQLRLLRSLPQDIAVSGFGTSSGIVTLALHPPPVGTAELHYDRAGEFTLRWTDGNVDYSEMLDGRLLPSFVAAELPFVANPDAWEALGRHTHVRPALGRAHVNEHGFVTIRTANSQQLELASLPGLFRVNDTEFGLCAAYLDAIDRVEGLVWDREPQLAGVPGSAFSPSFETTSTFHGVFDPLVERMHRLRAQILCTDDPQDARVLLVSAFDRLAATPLLVVAPGATLWLWRALLERSGFDEDVTLVPLEDEALPPLTHAPAAVVCESPDAQSTRRLSALLAPLVGPEIRHGAVILGATATADERLGILAALRPAEFATDLPLPLRYPRHHERRAAEHLAPFSTDLSGGLELSDPVSTARLLRVTPSEQFLKALDLVTLRARDEVETLTEQHVALVCGTSSLTSPKLVRAVSVARDLAAAGRSVALLVPYRKAADLAQVFLRPTPTLTDHDVLVPVPGAVQLWCGSGSYPDLDGFDDVILPAYPYDPYDLAYAAACARVVLVHLDGTFDDLAALRLARGQGSLEVGPAEVGETRGVLPETHADDYASLDLLDDDIIVRELSAEETPAEEQMGGYDVDVFGPDSDDHDTYDHDMYDTSVYGYAEHEEFETESGETQSGETGVDVFDTDIDEADIDEDDIDEDVVDEMLAKYMTPDEDPAQVDDNVEPQRHQPQLPLF